MKIFNSFLLIWIWILSLSAGVVYLFYSQDWGTRAYVTLSVSTLRDGEYSRFMEVLEGFLNDPSSHIKIQSKEDSSGSIATIKQLSSGAADLGIVQANIGESVTNVSGITYVFDEVLFLLTTASNLVTSPYDLKNASLKGPFKIASLPKGSQTYLDLQALLKFYNYEIDKDYKIVGGTYQEGLDRLRNKDVDYAFFISGLGNTTIRESLQNPENKIRLIEPTNREAFIRLRPEYSEYRIPQGFYGKNSVDYKTIATRALLVCRTDIGESVVCDLTGYLFQNQIQLRQQFAFLTLKPWTESEDLVFPLHPGSRRYFDKDKPGYFERLATKYEPIVQFIIWTPIIGSWVISGVGLWKMRQRKQAVS